MTKKLSGFYPPAPKIFYIKLFKGKYKVVDSRNNKIAGSLTHLKDALRTVELKNNGAG